MVASRGLLHCDEANGKLSGRPSLVERQGPLVRFGPSSLATCHVLAWRVVSYARYI